MSGAKTNTEQSVNENIQRNAKKNCLRHNGLAELTAGDGISKDLPKGTIVSWDEVKYR